MRTGILVLSSGVLVASLVQTAPGTVDSAGSAGRPLGRQQLSALPLTALPNVPIVGRTTVAIGRDATRGVTTALVHGVRRIPGGTALYFSLGVPPGSAAVSATDLNIFQFNLPTNQVSGPVNAVQFLVDGPGGTVYTVLQDTQRRAIATDQGLGAPGTFWVFYEVLPALPASVTKVDVVLGLGDVVAGVPVEDGPLQPTVKTTAPLALGAGWPAIDDAAVASADATKSTFPLRTDVFTLDNSIATRSAGKQVTVDLSADVLFAVDSATLTPAAQAKIKVAADTINARAAGGVVSVVGHTDSTGTPAHNLDLSKRRAASVEAALKPLVTVAGVTFAVDGKGETEPVDTNATPEGRQANRRVGITFQSAKGPTS